MDVSSIMRRGNGGQEGQEGQEGQVRACLFSFFDGRGACRDFGDATQAGELVPHQIPKHSS